MVPHATDQFERWDGEVKYLDDSIPVLSDTHRIIARG
jgi:hypothetical protein